MKEEMEHKPLTVKIPKGLHRYIKVLASSKGLKTRELIIDLFEKKLKE